MAGSRSCPEVSDELYAKVLKYLMNLDPKEVEFSDEVGERTGSWKGGTIGCSFDIQKGETAEQALKRMEKTREFR